jgi:hypothetical protein
MSIIEDLLKRIAEGTEMNARRLATLTRFEQQKEATKVPNAFVTHIRYVGTQYTEQILSYNADRDSVTIFNHGPAGLLYDFERFEPNDVQAFNANVSAGAAHSGGLVPSGGYATIGTHAAIYATVDVAGTIAKLTVVQALYSTPVVTTAAEQHALGHGGAMVDGLALEADHIDRNRVLN